MRQTSKTIGLALAIAATTTAGALAQTNGVTATEVTFGMHTDLSGVAATYGVSSSNGVKMRFDEATVARLLEIAWWDWPAAKVAAAVPLLVKGDAAALAAFTG